MIGKSGTDREKWAAAASGPVVIEMRAPIAARESDHTVRAPLEFTLSVGAGRRLRGRWGTRGADSYADESGSESDPGEGGLLTGVGGQFANSPVGPVGEQRQQRRGPGANVGLLSGFRIAPRIALGVKGYTRASALPFQGLSTTKSQCHAANSGAAAC